MLKGCECSECTMAELLEESNAALRASTDLLRALHGQRFTIDELKEQIAANEAVLGSAKCDEHRHCVAADAGFESAQERLKELQEIEGTPHHTEEIDPEFYM